MTLFHIFLVAVIQGITEFLPISSSGHLILLPRLTGMTDQGLIVDVAVHVGTLFAVVLYFRSDVRTALCGLPRALTGRIDTPGARLALLLLVATVPVIIAGALLKLSGHADNLRSIVVIGWASIVFGLVLYWSDRIGHRSKTTEDWNVTDAMVIGLWQAVALIPGTSRAGITITGARLLGYRRHEAARISMLMSIPTIVASGVLLGAEASVEADKAVLAGAATAAAFAFAAALAALSLMIRFLDRVSFTPYVIYRVALGVVLLALAYG